MPTIFVKKNKNKKYKNKYKNAFPVKTISNFSAMILPFYEIINF